MKNLDNNFNVNSNRTYAPNLKKVQDVQPDTKQDEFVSEITLEDGAKAADSYGRILVKPSNIDSATPVQSVVDSLDYLLNNYEIAAAAMKASDDAYDLLLADNVPEAYEKSCSGAIDAAYTKLN